MINGVKEYNAKWEQTTGRPALVWNSLETYFIWILKQVEEVGWERMLLGLGTEIRCVWSTENEWKTCLVRLGSKSHAFHQKNSTNCLVPTTTHETICDTVWKSINIQSKLENVKIKVLPKASHGLLWVLWYLLHDQFLLAKYITQARICLLLSLVWRINPFPLTFVKKKKKKKGTLH